jgi:CBS domain containing-hemolysin-like protein
MNGSNGNASANLRRPPGFWAWLRGLFGGRNGESALRDSIEEIIEELEEGEDEEAAAVPIGSDERSMLGNILKLRHMRVDEVMVPRADITAIDVEASYKEAIATFAEKGHSRLPVYEESLDNVLGMVHVKDLIALPATGEAFDLKNFLRRALIVAPSMRVIDLLLEMRLSRLHLALVVDEFGGIDGLITIEDLVEEIVGEIEDEHDQDSGPTLEQHADGTILADGRATIKEFEDLIGPVLSEQEREDDIDTLGGLVFYIADRVPARGELIRHAESGICFEVLEADPRRVKRLRASNLPKQENAPATETAEADGD